MIVDKKDIRHLESSLKTQVSTLKGSLNNLKAVLKAKVRDKNNLIRDNEGKLQKGLAAIVGTAVLIGAISLTLHLAKNAVRGLLTVTLGKYLKKKKEALLNQKKAAFIMSEANDYVAGIISNDIEKVTEAIDKLLEVIETL
ncbi:hypothetical protein COV17_01075 [Candidatus Woesearchaeota archaeon CG10_big_fil_rev_8_21_14_0_10_36_11]|nr:MAG: hypothetical protein COV17_01075 [Candidatus Woesearchaeota archaeon CG10_big_fil_rev_8_21_14_0_10_36_11]